jgi:hypothetical protein
LTKLGIDSFTLIWRVNGPDPIVMHEHMSLTMLNFQMARIYSLIKSTKYDLFYPEIELDVFNRHHLYKTFYWFEKLFERGIIKEFGNCDISALSLQDEGPEEHVVELMDLVEDDRVGINGFNNGNFVQYLLEKNGEETIGEGEQPFFMTPHFLQHFDMTDVICPRILIWKVNYMSL